MVNPEKSSDCGKLKEIPLTNSSDEAGRCVTLAQLYQDSWNKLRDHEWRQQITLWAAFIVVFCVLLCGGIKAFGVEISSPESIAPWVRRVMYAGLFVITVLFTVGSTGMQWAFRHYERNRDAYLAMATIKSNEYLYDWKKADGKQFFCSWHNWNSIVSVASTFFVTGFLALLSYVLISQKNLEIEQSFKGKIESVKNIGNCLHLKVSGESANIFVSCENVQIEQAIAKGDDIDTVCVASSRGYELLKAKITKATGGQTLAIGLNVVP